MSAEWSTIRLADCGVWLSGGTPSKANPDYWSGDIPWVSPKDMNERFIWDAEDHVTEAGVVNGSRPVPEGTILFVVRSMTLAHRFQVAITRRPVAFNQDLKAILCYPTVDPQYLFYSLLGHSEAILGLVDEATHGTKRLRTDALGSLEIPLPPLPEQRAIAHILGTLDDKIELNRRMNATLEALARALFQSWFVDFDPVRAKMGGRWQRGQSLPGLPAHLYDLFPDRLVDSELGEIPEGWVVGSFGNFTSQRSERVGNREAIVLSAIASGKLVRSDDHFTKRVYSKEIEKYLLVEQWDFAYNPSRINIGSIGMLENDALGAVSPVYVVVRPMPAYRWFLEFSIRREHTKQWINTLASGSVRQTLSYTDYASIPCVIPPEAVVQEFNRTWSVWREVIRFREAENRSLAAIRDALLPKLISGELRVGEAERLVEAQAP
jgi:type I restriction enzyme S subunit